MAAERLNSIRSQMIPAYGLAAIETWSSAFKLLGTCPALLNERVVCNGCTAAISDMLGSFTIDWTAACCLYCINLEQPNGLKRTLPDAILAQLRSLADSDATHGAVRLLAAWALTSSLQFAGLDPRLSRLGILMTTTSSPFMRDRVLYSRMVESLWSPQLRSQLSSNDRTRLEIIVAETREVNQGFVGMEFEENDYVLVNPKSQSIM